MQRYMINGIVNSSRVVCNAENKWIDTMLTHYCDEGVVQCVCYRSNDEWHCVRRTEGQSEWAFLCLFSWIAYFARMHRHCMAAHCDGRAFSLNLNCKFEWRPNVVFRSHCHYGCANITHHFGSLLFIAFSCGDDGRAMIILFRFDQNLNEWISKFVPSRICRCQFVL